MLDTRYSDTHVWARVDGDGTAVIGISDYAQSQLGDVVFVELPDIGRELSNGEEISVVESVKSTSELFSPLTGTVVEVNEALGDTPELINGSPLDDGWIIRIEIDDDAEFEELMDETRYEEFVESL